MSPELTSGFVLFVFTSRVVLALRLEAVHRRRAVNAPWRDATPLSGADYSAAELSEQNDCVWLLDQLALPSVTRYHSYRTSTAVADAIRDMVVRGAPAIGIAAAYGMTLAALEQCQADATGYVVGLQAAAEGLIATRPTAVNLSWAVERCLMLAREHATAPGAARHVAMAELARSIHRDDVAACKAMGAHGAERIESGMTVLTHCNAGALATGGYGTALGVIRAAADAGKQLKVFASETRPYLQGARLTSWELHQDGIDVTVISDNMVGHCMQQGLIDAVVVGADRVVANGDVANKIGTYAIACLAQHHGLPFFVAAPWSTFDLQTKTGADIVIEQRSRGELVQVGQRQLVADGIAVYNPAFDVTPASLVETIFTERGPIDPAVIPAGE